MQKLALTSPTSGGRSVGIVRSWTHATEFVLNDASMQEPLHIANKHYDFGIENPQAVPKNEGNNILIAFRIVQI
jgi:hypothetical protein